MNRLTIAYLFTEGLDRDDWKQEFLNDIASSRFTPVEFPGILGDLAEARCLAYDQITTPYAMMLDPDDRISPDVLDECFRYAVAHPEVGMVSAHENSIDPLGRRMNTASGVPFDMERFLYSPQELHSFTILKMEHVREFVPVLRSVGFYNFDWALRLCIANKYGAYKLPKIGQHFRRKFNSHHNGAHYKPELIPSNKTVETLVDMGLLPVVSTGR